MKLTRTTRTAFKAMSVRRSQRIVELIQKQDNEEEASFVGNITSAQQKKRQRFIKKINYEVPEGSKGVEVSKKKRKTSPGVGAQQKKRKRTNKKINYKPEGSEGVEVCISFDTTGSMYACLDEVRRSVKATIGRLLNDIPHIRIALVAHGDYGDEKTAYLIKTLDHTNDKKALIDWVNNVGRTHGFDGDECYELVLRDVQDLSWSPSCRNRSLVLIGDAKPHELEPRHRNPYQIEWRKEAQKLKEMNVKIYAVHALHDNSSKDFYQSLATITAGTYLKLPQFDSIVDFLCGICYGQNDRSQVEAYEKELRARRGDNELAPEVTVLFNKLLGREVAVTVAKNGGIKPVSRGRFKTLDVDSNVQLKSLVHSNGLNFKTGRGFYQFTKPEVISMKKEIMLAHKETGEMYTGESARLLLGITETTSEAKQRIRPSDFMEFDIFVQSTSYNRILTRGTKFMYEVAAK